MGLLAGLRVDERFGPGDLATGLREEISVTATVLGPSWVSADRVELFANGVKIQDRRIEPTGAIEKARIAWTLRRPAQDTHLIVIATGPGVSAPCWAIPRPYQPSSKSWTPRVVGSTNPIWLDADGDGAFTAPRALAAQLLAHAGGDPVRLLPALAGHDRAVAIQAASLLQARSGVKMEDLDAALKTAPEFVRAAFADFFASLELRKPTKGSAPP